MAVTWTPGSIVTSSVPQCLRLTGDGSLMPKEPAQKEIRGWRALGSLERTSRTCLGWWESKMLWEDVVSCLQNRKKGTDPPYKHVCMYVQTYMHVCTHMSTRDFTAFEMYRRLRLRTWMLPGWRGGRSCEEAGHLAMPKMGNQSQER